MNLWGFMIACGILTTAVQADQRPQDLEMDKKECSPTSAREGTGIASQSLDTETDKSDASSAVTHQRSTPHRKGKKVIWSSLPTGASPQGSFNEKEWVDVAVVPSLQRGSGQGRRESTPDSRGRSTTLRSSVLLVRISKGKGSKDGISQKVLEKKSIEITPYGSENTDNPLNQEELNRLLEEEKKESEESK